MSKITSINGDIYKFLEKRPTVLDAVAYGSRAIKQSNYSSNKSDIDLLLVVDNMLKWHQQNAEMNPQDYSKSALFILTKEGKLYDFIRKMGGRMTFISSIKEGNNTFKYGIIEKNDAIASLNGVTNYYAGRRQKPTISIKTDNDIAKKVKTSQQNVRLMALYAIINNPTIYNLFKNIVVTSYHGDIRMLLGENPNKVHNIIMGAYEQLKEMYAYNSDEVAINLDTVTIDKELLVELLPTLPQSFVADIDLSNCKNIDKKISKINHHLKRKYYQMNLKESTLQPLKGILTTGPLKAIQYGYKKVQKKFSR